MTKYTELSTVLTLLEEAQDADTDIRDAAREAHHFIDKRDGQWELDIVQKFKGRPRYTFDKCNPIVDQIAGEMENADFTLRIRPSGGDASKDNAKIYDGLIRNIRNTSDAEAIFDGAGRSMITGGMDGWEVVQDWIDADAFEQDLFIRRIHNWVDRVWFLGTPEEQDNSDAEAVVVLSTMTMREYKEEFPDSETTGSIGDDKRTEVYHQKMTDTITIGRIQYKKPEDIEIVRMTNGAVYKVDDKFEKVQSELKAQGIDIEKDDEGEEKRRIRKSWRVYSRIFNNDDWLSDEEETVFDLLPVCATYGNFKISENKRLSRGVIEKLIDPQRVYNYSASRQIEEGALAPRGKYWMTPEQSAGHTKTLATLNTNADPMQHYNQVDGHQLPFWQGGAQINPGLQIMAQQASEDLNQAAGLFSANMGDNPGLQSGVAIDRQISKGDNSTTKWFNSQEVAICYTAKVLLSAIPRVYDSTRQIRILNEDGTFDMQTLNQKVVDEQTGQIVELNNLAAGDYDATCEVGLAFKSKQREAASAFAEMAAIDPTITSISQDIWFNNLDAPGMDLVAERSRAIKLQEGVIPQTQWTDEEKQQAQQAQQAAQGQEQQPDPMLLAAQAEMVKGQAEAQNAQNKQTEIQMTGQVKMADIQLRNKQLDLDVAKFQKADDSKLNIEAAKLDQGQQTIDLKAQQQQFNQVLLVQQQRMDELTSAVNNLKTIQDASPGVTIMGPGLVDNLKDQSDIVSKEQGDLD